jgi:hypothetical protein
VLFTPQETTTLLGALKVVADNSETQLNDQGGNVVLEMPADVARESAKVRAKEQKIDPKYSPGLEYEVATEFLRSQPAANFGLNYARQFVENPVVMYGDVKHAYVVPGPEPKKPLAYRIRLQIGRKPFA